MSSSAGCRRKTRTSNRVTTPKNKARRKTTRRVQPPRVNIHNFFVNIFIVSFFF